MKNKKFKLFITSHDVNNFGTSYSISKFLIYFLTSFFMLIVFFFIIWVLFFIFT